MRITSLKMMAERFVVSSTTMYQWLVLPHLADLNTLFPADAIQYFEREGWDSAMKKVKMHTLARDEFHEGTASKDIQLIIPRSQTKRNM